MFILDPDDPGGTGKPGGISGSAERKSPSGVQESPWWGLGAKPPPKQGSGAELPEAEQVLMIIKTFLAEIFLIKSSIHTMIRTLNYSVLIFSRQLSK